MASYELLWLRTNTPNAVRNAAGRGDVEQLRVILEHGMAPFDPQAYISAWMGSQVDMLLYLLETRPEPWTPEFPALVAEAGHLELLKLLHPARGLHGICVDAMNKPAAKGHLDVVRFLHEHTDAACTPDAMDEAATRGHLDVVQFMHEHCTEGCTTRAMDEAARLGRLDVVQFLQAHRTEGCTTRAMDLAAGWGCLFRDHSHNTYRHDKDDPSWSMNNSSHQGHFDVIAFLHNNRIEGCTTDAMDRAAAYGYLDIVQFLHQYRSEGCTTRAMGDAAANGHLEVVLFLHVNRTEGCEQSHLKDLLLVGAFDVWLDMRERYPFDDGAKKAMEEAGRLKNLPTIRFLCDDMGRYDLLPHAMSCLTHDHVGWIYALSPPAIGNWSSSSVQSRTQRRGMKTMRMGIEASTSSVSWSLRSGFPRARGVLR